MGTFVKSAFGSSFHAPECTLDLGGKILEFSFSPAETINCGEKTNLLIFKSLKTFQTFQGGDTEGQLLIRA
jgi:hypothetical protein